MQGNPSRKTIDGSLRIRGQALALAGAWQCQDRGKGNAVIVTKAVTARQNLIALMPPLNAFIPY